MKLLRESLGNIISLPDMNLVVTLISFLFYCKGFDAGRFPIVKFNYHFSFSWVKTLNSFFIHVFEPSFFLFFCFFLKESTASNSSSICLS